MSSPPPQPPVPHATLLLVGPVFIGALFSWLLMGISTVQLYLYHISFRDDRKVIVALVYVVYVLDIFGTVVAASMGWHVLCAGWGRTINLATPGWTFSAIGAVDGLGATMFQVFYAWRIYVLKKWRVVPAAIILVALAQLGATLSITVGIANLKNLEQLHDFFPRTCVWLGGGAFADIMISIAMVSLLFSAKKNSHSLNSSDRVINRLIALSVETGMVTAASAIIELALFLGSQDTNLHLTFALILGKIYSNTLMTSLNSRVSSRQPGKSSSMATNPHTGANRADIMSPTGTRPVVGVHISSRTEVFSSGRYMSDPDHKMEDWFKLETLGEEDVEMLGRPVTKPAFPMPTRSEDNVYTV
ncbi:hypothetical protein OF83DRAFT_1168055 [Amylostereum chailletii]|nr:hypothetical protein OF83DRAFT_1168055 [Amylostereum chailletii]